MPFLVDQLLPPGPLLPGGQPTLSGGAAGTVLRPWKETDAAALAEVFRDPAIQRWHLRRVESLDEAREWIAGWRHGWAHGTAVHWAVVGADDDALLARVSLQRFDRHLGQAEISYWTAPTARGRGVCPAAVTAATSWALGEAGFARLELQHSTANPASCRVAEKTGYPLEGIRRRAMRHLDGPHDMHLHARVKP